MSDATISASSNENGTPPLVVHPNLRGVFVGSGSDGMAEPEISRAILDLVQAQEEPKHVLYLGTATYDLPQFATRQTQGFLDAGCQVECLNLVDKAVSRTQLQQSVDWADIVIVGGGNTLFAIDRWNRLGLAELLHKRSIEKRGILLTGGSAGAICWFSAGHSDSMDPDSYQHRMERQFGLGNSNSDSNVEESTTLDEANVKEWKYIRVPGLGMLPGILCPHHDRVQSNGVLRADDFDSMLLQQHERHGRNGAPEVGIGIDHWAALVVEGEGRYRVLSLPNKPGSVLCHGNGAATFARDGSGVPGIWIKTATNDGRIYSRACPEEGELSDILNGVVYEMPEDSVEMQLLHQCRAENPDNGPVLKES